MEGLKAVQEVNELTLLLDSNLQMLKKYGIELAQREADYKQALAEESEKLKAQSMPVTLIDKVVYGHVAKQRFARDTAEVMYQVAKEQIMINKLKLRILENQIAREWGQA